MRNGLYPRLAAVNLRKNRQTWLPYLFTCIGTIMMFYIMLTLQSDPALANMSGGAMLGSMLTMGCVVIGVFALILMFYANSFIIKQRKKEFGLYNILGMEKRHVGRVLMWETIYTALISYAVGIALGILFSKLMQLLLLKILRFDIRFGLYISPFALGATALLFAGIFALTLLNSLRIIHLSKPVELLHGSQEGEREPKSKWILALLGVLSLGAGYGLAVTVKNGVEAVSMFFIAVLFVIAGTYLLFTAFSIVFLKRLRANKNYYYKTSHFATVSGMLYRMKKNAGGLASICILSTMVLVTVSTTVCLYVGVDDMLRSMYPNEISVTSYDIETAEQRAAAENRVLSAVKEQKLNVINYKAYYLLNFQTTRDGNCFSSGLSSRVGGINSFDAVTAADYNAMTGQNVTLSAGKALLYTPNRTGSAVTGGKLTICGRSYDAEAISSFPITERYDNIGWEFYFLVVSDEAELRALTQAQTTDRGGAIMTFMVNFDLDGTQEQKAQCANAMSDAMLDVMPGGTTESHASVTGRSMNYSEFVSMYGGLFFLGLFLGSLFLMATVLIIYYKQVTEGYDDRERFRIMQNVGMTNSEVKKTIHSQVLIVFFLPLAATIIHVGFAFPMIRRMLSLFGLANIALFAYCTFAAIAVFAVLYTLVYIQTSRTYYKIVS